MRGTSDVKKAKTIHKNNSQSLEASGMFGFFPWSFTEALLEMNGDQAIGRSNGARDLSPSLGPISFIFMQFSVEKWAK